MKARKVGKALEDAISARPSELKTTKSRAQMMNPIRREIFQHLCRYPCSTISKISRAVNRSIHTVEWHLKKLIEDNYISEGKESKTTIYYPHGFLEPKDLAILATLNIQKIKEIFLYILMNPGSTQTEISTELKISHQNVNRITEKLKMLKLITTVDDGKFKRHYPSELLELKMERNHERAKNFKKAILDKLGSEGLNPKLTRASDAEIMIQLTRGKEKAFLRLSCEPFATVLT